MRIRLNRNERRAEIILNARKLFRTQGFAKTEMEDIRRMCAISRGGLYHHFGSKTAILDAILEEEVGALAKELEQADTSPIAALLRAGSGQLGNEPGVVASLKSTEERLVYLSSLEQAIAARLSPALQAALVGWVAPEIDPGHLAELFLTVNTHINRRVILGQWSEPEAARFAATALLALAPLLRKPAALDPTIEEFRLKGCAK